MYSSSRPAKTRSKASNIPAGSVSLLANCLFVL